MPRSTALAALLEITENDAFADLTVKKALQNTKLSARDKAFCAELIYGTVQNLRFLDYQINSVSSRPAEKMTADVRNILRMALYQICFLRVPDRAAVDEAVKLTKRRAYSAAGFVNGVLRSFLRKGSTYPEEPLKKLGVMYSFPDWIVSLWADAYGKEKCEALLKASGILPPLSVRINRLKTSKEKIMALCTAENAETEHGLYVSEPRNIANTPLYGEGLISIQDIGAQEAVLRLAPKPGEKILDACAAPGGKTAYIAELMDNTGSITAWDIYAHKTELIRRNADRLGIDIIHTGEHDATESEPSLSECFDRILADVPCSGLGIIRKKPDIKWKRKPGDITALIETQKKILKTVSGYLKKGGTLVYATCTLNPAENEDVIDAFLKENDNFYRDGDDITLFPNEGKTDGFFIAKLGKR